ncbi:hypothetical protein [Paenibacillus ferrarius]|uniref:hypothetical protein n=1 Tax=Paenibacillus ferrarius TaxID=1469647 RepID=UPI00117FBC0B|nr:hypothetical protein [Paenibacillus ferrarius]
MWEKPAIMHPFCLRNQQLREKPAIMHPLEPFFRFKDKKSLKSLHNRRLSLFSHVFIEKACIFAGFSKLADRLHRLNDDAAAYHGSDSAHSLPPRNRST